MPRLAKAPPHSPRFVSAHVHGKRSQNESNYRCRFENLSPSQQDTVSLLFSMCSIGPCYDLLLSLAGSWSRVQTSETSCRRLVSAGSNLTDSKSAISTSTSTLRRCEEGSLTTPCPTPSFCPTLQIPKCSCRQPCPRPTTGEQRNASAPGPAPCAAPHVPAVSVPIRIRKCVGVRDMWRQGNRGSRTHRLEWPEWQEAKCERGRKFAGHERNAPAVCFGGALSRGACSRTEFEVKVWWRSKLLSEDLLVRARGSMWGLKEAAQVDIVTCDGGSGFRDVHSNERILSLARCTSSRGCSSTDWS